MEEEKEKAGAWKLWGNAWVIGGAARGGGEVGNPQKFEAVPGGPA